MLQVVADCECTHPKNGIRRTFSTVTLVTENMSVLSYDIENQDSIESSEPTRDEDHGGQMCPICLEEYALGDNISWSRHQNCRHAFHKNCIEGWLKQLDREGCCPFCRGPYLNKSKDVDKKEDELMTIIVVDDVESQQAVPADGTPVDPTAEEANEQKKPVDVDNSKQETTKAKPVYNSFCIVHGLLR